MKSFSASLLLATLLLGTALRAQSIRIEPVPHWRASVDDTTQLIHLIWNPCPDSTIKGYHICTGDPCLDYATVLGHLDTTYICADHSPLERHLYRIHVFDSAGRTSEETDPFGNIVLQAVIPECDNTVTATWNACSGLSGHLLRYSLQAKLEPLDTDYREIYSATNDDALSYSLTLPEAVTHVSLRVQASFDDNQQVLSNRVALTRATADTAAYFDITDLRYDSVNCIATLRFRLDTAYHAAPYTLWRSREEGPWTLLGTVSAANYTDRDINPYDSLYCYRLSVVDGCGLNIRYSNERCLHLPEPEEPAVWLPNTLIVSDEANRRFLPSIKGRIGKLYELTIYDRHGLLVYKTTSPTAGWTPEGTMQGVYTYALRLRLSDNRIKTYTGNILVIK